MHKLRRPTSVDPLHSSIENEKRSLFQYIHFTMKWRKNHSNEDSNKKRNNNTNKSIITNCLMTIIMWRMQQKEFRSSSQMQRMII